MTVIKAYVRRDKKIHYSATAAAFVIITIAYSGGVFLLTSTKRNVTI